MRYLGLDIGSKRIGVAVTDPEGRFAVGLDVIERSPDVDLASQLVSCLAEHEIEEIEVIVLGLPVRSDGRHGPEVDAVRAVGEEIRSALEIPVAYYDERFSSRIAESAGRTMGKAARKQRGSVDRAAATIILQGYVDRQRRSR